MKATYTCLMAGGARRTFASDSGLSVEEIKDRAQKHLKEQVLDLVSEQLHGSVEDEDVDEPDEVVA